MSPEIINEVALTATAVGYGLGQVAEQLAVRKYAQREESFNESWDLPEDELQAVSPPRLNRVGAAALAPLALVGGLTVGLNAYAWAPESAAQTAAPATLEVVVDHSGATNQTVNGKPISAEINQIVDQFNGSSLKTEAIVSNTGTNTTMKLDQVSANQPFGPSVLPTALTLALNRTAEVTPRSDGKPAAGVLVLTNGNDIGNAKAVEQAAGKTPVFVVNVEGASAGPATTESLQAIASKTGGDYWSAGQQNLDSVAHKVRDTIQSTEEVNQQGGDNRWPLRAFGALAALVTAETYRRRKDMPFGHGSSTRGV